MDEGGVEHRPRLSFDHALIAVPDLDRSVAEFESRYGLKVFPGGRHPGVGTANAIAPLGARQYLELITVVDRTEAERDPLRRRVLDALDSGTRLAAWVLRSEDLDATAAAVELTAQANGSRLRPDGTRLEWRTAELAPVRAGSGIPFLIDWGDTEHPGGATGSPRVRRVVLEGVGAALSDFDIDVEVEVRDATGPRLLAVELDGLTIE